MNEIENADRSPEQVARGAGNGHEFIEEKLYEFETDYLIVTKIGSDGMSWNGRRGDRPYPMLCSALALSDAQRSILNLAPIPDQTVYTPSNATTCCDLVNSIYVAGRENP